MPMEKYFKIFAELVPKSTFQTVSSEVKKIHFLLFSMKLPSELKLPARYWPAGFVWFFVCLFLIL